MSEWSDCAIGPAIFNEPVSGFDWADFQRRCAMLWGDDPIANPAASPDTPYLDLVERTTFTVDPTAVDADWVERTRIARRVYKQLRFDMQDDRRRVYEHLVLATWRMFDRVPMLKILCEMLDPAPPLDEPV